MKVTSICTVCYVMNSNREFISLLLKSINYLGCTLYKLHLLQVKEPFLYSNVLLSIYNEHLNIVDN